jgi:cold shock CspA family protein
MSEGRIESLKEGGYGFIDVGEKQGLFFHASNVVEPLQFDELQEGDKVSYELGKGRDDRQRAENVRKI